MELKQVNEIFKTKYQNGEIYASNKDYSKNKTSVQVIFDETKQKIKVYHYNVVNYVELLQKLGFNIIYKKDIEAIQKKINRLQNEIQNGGYYDDLFDCVVKFSINEMQQKKEMLNTLQNKLQNAIII